MGTTYNLLIFDTSVNVTASLESRYRQPPRRRVGILSGRDIFWCRSPGKEPDIDGLACPFCSDHAASGSIEASAIGPGVLTLNVATCIGVLAWG